LWKGKQYSKLSGSSLFEINKEEFICLDVCISAHKNQTLDCHSKKNSILIVS
jgi:hypothetical protein